MADKLIPVETWAATRYDPVPSPWVLRKWCRNGEIHPAPERVSREWRVLETAKRVTAAGPVRGGLLAQLEGAT